MSSRSVSRENSGWREVAYPILPELVSLIGASLQHLPVILALFVVRDLLEWHVRDVEDAIFLRVRACEKSPERG